MKYFDGQVTARVKGDKRLVTRDEAIDMIEEKFKDLDYRMDTLFLQAKAAALDDYRGELHAALKALPEAQILALTAANLVVNSDTAIKRVNFFNPSIGAVINPHIGTETKRGNYTWWQRVYLRLRGYVDNPPSAALTPWQDEGDCWCSEKPDYHPAMDKKLADDYVAQFGVLLPRAIAPTHVTIEHIPRSGTLDKGSAPKLIELWVEVKAAQGFLAYDVKNAFGRVASEENLERMGIPQNYLLVARFEYDWSDTPGLNHVQTFPLNVDMTTVPAYTRQAIIRTRTNYGADHTCFYRVRLHGETPDMYKRPN